MLDSIQILLILVIIVLSLLLVVLGIQVFLILKDVRRTIQKTNKVLDEASSITEQVAGPIASLSTLISTVKAGSFITIIKLVKGLLSKDKDEKKHEKE